MLNLYAVKVWHSCEPRHFETIEVRTYTAGRAEDLATESYPGCKAAASPAPLGQAARTGASLPGLRTSNTTRPDG